MSLRRWPGYTWASGQNGPVGSLSFRDRFFSPSVAKALTSPSGILSLGAGAAVGIVATAPVAVPLAAAGAVIGGLVGLGIRVAVALPRNEPADKIDPFAVSEPWRHAVIDAVKSRARFTQAVKTFRDGPLKASVSAIDDRLDDAVNECFRVALQGQLVADGRKNINDREVAAELAQARAQGDGRSDQTETRNRRIESLEAQLQTAHRMDDLIESTKDQLDLLNARLDEAVTRAIELSVSNQGAEVGALGSDVDGIVDDLQSLRLAMEDVRGGSAPAPSASGSPTDLPSSSVLAQPPPPPLSDVPPPLPRNAPAAPSPGPDSDQGRAAGRA